MISFILSLHFHYVSQTTILVNSENLFESKGFLSTLEEKTHAYQSLVAQWWNLAREGYCVSLIDLPSPFNSNSTGFGKTIVVEHIFVFKHLEFLLP